MAAVMLAARVACWYAGQLRPVGEVFEASPRDAALLITLGRAIRVQEPPKRTYRRRDLQAEE